jgi:hypothetical protein
LDAAGQQIRIPSAPPKRPRPPQVYALASSGQPVLVPGGRIVTAEDGVASVISPDGVCMGAPAAAPPRPARSHSSTSSQERLSCSLALPPASPAEPRSQMRPVLDAEGKPVVDEHGVAVLQVVKRRRPPPKRHPLLDSEGNPVCLS